MVWLAILDCQFSSIYNIAWQPTSLLIELVFIDMYSIYQNNFEMEVCIAYIFGLISDIQDVESPL